jgi:UDP-glucose 4-epimerase
MRVLVTGGAGYVGSHSVRALREAGHEVTVLDSLEKGHSRACAGAELVMGNTADLDLVRAVLTQNRIECVMHFAAYIEVGESMRDPARYYANNTAATAYLLQACCECDVRQFVFSSTCAVYGQPETVPMREDAPRRPLSAYGRSKLLTEEILESLDERGAMRYVALRYFNASGAHPAGDIGEAHSPETHLIPLILQVALGQREAIKIFGTDYPTPDGTCVRDYIHVLDLARAHLAAMEYLAAGGASAAFNVGTGTGYSVREIIEVCREVTGHAIPAQEEARRPGDPPALYADPAAIRAALGWEPTMSDIRSLVASAWAWHQSHPHGFASV